MPRHPAARIAQLEKIIKQRDKRIRALEAEVEVKQALVEYFQDQATKARRGRRWAREDLNAALEEVRRLESMLEAQ